MRHMDFPAIPAPTAGLCCLGLFLNHAPHLPIVAGVVSLEVEDFLEAADGPPKQGARLRW